MSVFSPAVSHDRPGVGRVEELDLSYESEQSGGVAGDAVVGPAGEVKLTEFADLVMTLLENTHGRDVTTRDAYFTAAIAQNDSVPFCLLMMTNAPISQILSWPFWERLTRRHIMVQQTNLQLRISGIWGPCSLFGFRRKINRSSGCQDGTLGHFWERETGRLIAPHLPNLQGRFEETDGHFGAAKKD